MPALAAVILFALTMAAGRWQLARAHYKESLRQRFDAAQAEVPFDVGTQPAAVRDMDFHRASAHGIWLPERTIFLDNRVQGGVAGYEVVMPLRLPNTARVLLVNRGWVRSDGHRDRLPQVPTPAGEISLTGRVNTLSGHFLELAGEAAPGRIWQNLTLERYARWSGLELQPFLLEQTSPAEDGLVRNWPAVDFGIDRHYGYALQWFAFAAITAFLFVFLSLRKVA